MADTLTGAHRAACRALQHGSDRLDEQTLATLINHYLGALAKGRTDNNGHHGELADKARTLIRRFHRYQDMILRFATDLTVPWTNNEAERAVRPVKIQQRTSGGGWRTLTGLTEFALVHSYLSLNAPSSFDVAPDLLMDHGCSCWRFGAGVSGRCVRLFHCAAPVGPGGGWWGRSGVLRRGEGGLEQSGPSLLPGPPLWQVQV